MPAKSPVTRKLRQPPAFGNGSEPQQLDIEYKEFTIDMMSALKDSDQPLLPKVVKTINGVPLEECDSRTKMLAGFEVTRFLVQGAQVVGVSLDEITSDDGDS